jgi:hypothetical protein
MTAYTYMYTCSPGGVLLNNRSWKLGVDSHEAAWSAAARSALGSLCGGGRGGGGGGASPAGEQHARCSCRQAVWGMLGRPPPIVLDLGTGYTKSGFAGQPAPSQCLANFVVLPQSEQLVEMGRLPADSAVLDQFLRAAVFAPLSCDPSQHAVLLISNTYSSALIRAGVRGPDGARMDEERLAAAAACLKRIGVPAVKIVHSASLALRGCQAIHSLDGTRVETGVVLDIGLGMSACRQPYIRMPHNSVCADPPPEAAAECVDGAICSKGDPSPARAAGMECRGGPMLRVRERHQPSSARYAAVARGNRAVPALRAV